MTLRGLIRPLAVLVLSTAPAFAVQTKDGNQATLRAIDKVTGAVADLNVPAGGQAVFGHMTVDVGECRYPVLNPSGDAFAWVEIQMTGDKEPSFKGWMIASAPALDALDDPRYDVWLLRCTTS